MNVVFYGASNPQIIKGLHDIMLENCDYNCLGFIDNDPEKQNKPFFGFKVLGGDEVIKGLVKSDVFFVNTITRNMLMRRETSEDLTGRGCRFINFIHPSINTNMVKLGVGNVVEENVTIQAAVTIGNHCAFDSGSVIAHEAVIGDYVFFAPSVVLAGKVTIGDGALIGTNATILPRITIGKYSTIGAGAVVTKDVPDYVVVAGNPARILRNVNTV